MGPGTANGRWGRARRIRIVIYIHIFINHRGYIAVVTGYIRNAAAAVKRGYCAVVVKIAARVVAVHKLVGISTIQISGRNSAAAVSRLVPLAAACVAYIYRAAKRGWAVF